MSDARLRKLEELYREGGVVLEGTRARRTPVRDGMVSSLEIESLVPCCSPSPKRRRSPSPNRRRSPSPEREHPKPPRKRGWGVAEEGAVAERSPSPADISDARKIRELGETLGSCMKREDECKEEIKRLRGGVEKAASYRRQMEEHTREVCVESRRNREENLTLKASVAALQRQVRDLKADNERVREERGKSKEEARGLEGRVRCLEAENARLRERLTEGMRHPNQYPRGHHHQYPRGHHHHHQDPKAAGWGRVGEKRRSEDEVPPTDPLTSMRVVMSYMEEVPLDYNPEYPSVYPVRGRQ